MHRSRKLMNELRRAELEMVEHESKVEALNTEIAKISQELEAFPSLSDYVVVDITADAVIFLTASSEFTLTRDELQVLVELLGGEPEEEDEEEEDEEDGGEEDGGEEEWPDYINDKAMASLVVDAVTKKALLYSSRENWYYRVRCGNPLKTVFSDGRTWKFRQFLARKAQNKNPQKLAIEVIGRARNGRPCQHVMTRTLWFGAPESE